MKEHGRKGESSSLLFKVQLPINYLLCVADATIFFAYFMLIWPLCVPTLTTIGAPVKVSDVAVELMILCYAIRRCECTISSCITVYFPFFFFHSLYRVITEISTTKKRERKPVPRS